MKKSFTLCSMLARDPQTNTEPLTHNFMQMCQETANQIVEMWRGNQFNTRVQHTNTVRLKDT